MKEYIVQRFSTGAADTLGALFRLRSSGRREFKCFTLEDEMRVEKFPDETRIPPGTYAITLREEGGMYPRYKQKYAPWHKGMLWLREVPGFEWIYIHPGSTDDDTSGCLLVGDGVGSNVGRDGRLLYSVVAYERLYREIVSYIGAGESVFITIKDYA